MSRDALDGQALGSRSPIEEEHDLDPMYLLCALPIASFPVDDTRRLPVFATMAVAEVCAAAVQQQIPGLVVVPVPAWASAVRELVADDSLSPAEQAMKTYVFEAQTLDENDAVHQAIALGDRIAALLLEGHRP